MSQAPVPAPGSLPSDLQMEWTDHPSQWLNLLIYLGAGLLAVLVGGGLLLCCTYWLPPGSTGRLVSLVVGVSLLGLITIWVLKRFLDLRTITYRVTRGNLEITTGILVRRTEMIELYRIRDLAASRPLHLRLFGLGQVMVLSSDRTAPETWLSGIHDPLNVVRNLREEVERARLRARVLGLEADKPEVHADPVPAPPADGT